MCSHTSSHSCGFEEEFILREVCARLQALHSEVQSLEPSLPALASVVTSLCPTAPEDKVRQLKEELENLQKRFNLQNKVIPQR